MKLKQIIPLIAICFAFFGACKKKTDPAPTPVDPSTARADLTRDSIFYYAKEIYLWSDALPTYTAFNPRKYTGLSTNFDNYEKELIDLAQYKINPATGIPYEYYLSGKDSKYSYISDIANKNPTAYTQNEKASVDLKGNGNDFGLRLGYYGQGTVSGKQTFVTYVTAVNQNSPAEKAGIIRSHKILKINDKAYGSDFDGEITSIVNALNATTIKLEGVTYVNGQESAPFTINLTKAVYKSSPVFASKVFTAGTKKIGYLAYARFSELDNSKADFDAAFANFSSSGVTDLIIDLRYNGGGYVNTAQYLINQIAPSSANGKVMFSEAYNTLMQNGQATILKNQPFLDASGKVQFQNGKMITYADLDYTVAGNTQRFVKAGPLDNLANVIFIVSGNTASASELVINSLKPHMNVKLVGTQSYGKPVGFFPITIENKYEVYYSLFQTKNSLGQGDYFSGFTPDVLFTDARGNLDDPRNNFGDSKEYYTSVAINVIAPNVGVTSTGTSTMTIQGKNIAVESLVPLKPLVNGNEFVGMIETRHTIKK